MLFGKKGEKEAKKGKEAGLMHLATKRIKPGYFRVQREMIIAGRSCDGVGNATLLQAERFVHVRRVMGAANHGDAIPLRHYMNPCVLMARKGAVMVSPFISSYEKQVMQVLVRERLPFIYLTDNGFRDYYKPAVPFLMPVLQDLC